mgnify:CR=1 FL=1|jgi:hypothetical protein
MSSLIKILLNGITSMTSIESPSEEKDNKMLNFTTSVPELDKENNHLFQAAAILAKLGNTPELTAEEFDYELLLSGCDEEERTAVTLAAIAIETMISHDHTYADPNDFVEKQEPTVH